MREWLNAQAAGGFVEYDPAERPVHAPARAGDGAHRRDQPRVPRRASSRSPSARCSTRRGSPRPPGPATGVGWHDHVHDVHDGCERFFRPGYNANLVPTWLPALDGVVEKLEHGATVADVGCGHGSSTILMAQAFPNSTFVGSDYHEGSIETARARADEAGVGDRVRFEVAPAAGYPGTGYDLVTMFDCLHDMGDPAGAARHVRETLAADGTWMIVEPQRATAWRIVAAGVEQFAQRIFAIERHELVAQLIGHRVQRDRQHAADFLAGARDIRHDAGGRQCDAALGDAQAVAVGDDVRAHRAPLRNCTAARPCPSSRRW